MQMQLLTNLVQNPCLENSRITRTNLLVVCRMRASLRAIWAVIVVDVEKVVILFKRSRQDTAQKPDCRPVQVSLRQRFRRSRCPSFSMHAKKRSQPDSTAIFSITKEDRRMGILGLLRFSCVYFSHTRSRTSP